MKGNLNATAYIDILDNSVQAGPIRQTSVPDLTNALVAEWSLVPEWRLDVPSSSGKPFQKSGGCYSSKGGTNSILMLMILD